MDEDDALDRLHPGMVPVLPGEGAGEEVAVRLVGADLFLAGHEHLEFGLLDGLVRACRAILLASLDLREDLLVGETFEGLATGGFLFRSLTRSSRSSTYWRKCSQTWLTAFASASSRSGSEMTLIICGK